MTNQTVNINIHNPQIQSIERLHDVDGIIVTLGNNEYHGAVTLFVAEEWARELSNAVDSFFCNERKTA